MRYIKKIVFAALIVTLSACSHLSSVVANRDTAYLNAKTTPPLNIPPGLSSSSIHAEYPIADRNYPESAKRVSLVPPEL
jgi:uncharacterized lipoprotein